MREARMGDTGAGELLERKLKQTVNLTLLSFTDYNYFCMLGT